MKKIFAMLLTIIIMTASISCLTAVAAPAAHCNWRMEPGNGGLVTYLGFAAFNLNSTSGEVAASLNTGNLFHKNTGSSVGIDGTGACSFGAKAHPYKGLIMLIDTRTSGNNVQAGYTYFKSAMVKLDTETTDEAILASGRRVHSFHEIGGKGFLSSAEDFAAKLESYDGSTTIPSYDWEGKKDNSLVYTVTGDWQRYTEAAYRDGADSAGRDRAGWGILYTGADTKDIGNWEIVVDDYIILEVPNTALKSVAYPVVYDAQVTRSGNTLSAFAQIYDVNPLITPVAKYQWQKSSDGNSWSNISGATAKDYEITAADSGFMLRCAVSAESTTLDANNNAVDVIKSTDYSKNNLPAYTEGKVADMQKYTVKINSGVNGTATVNGETELSLDGGEKVNVVIAPNKGYQIEKILVNGIEREIAKEFTMTVTGDVVIDVTYKAKVLEPSAVYRNWRMEPASSGATVGYLGFVNMSINQGSDLGNSLSAGNLIQNRNGSAAGIDGTGAISFRAKDHSYKGWIGLIDFESQNSNVKAGYTYFKSAMMKLNPETTDSAILSNGRQIHSFREQDGPGFVVKAEDFASTLASYNGSSQINVYDWEGKKANSTKYILNGEWQRITEAVYRDTDAKTGRDRTGFGILYNAAAAGIGNWEIIVDDYIILEVPNSALKSLVYPVAYGATAEAKDGIVTATANVYDVNPLVTPVTKYQWQKSSDGNSWSDINGATSANYTVAAADAGMKLRCAITAESTALDDDDEVVAVVNSTTYSKDNLPCYTNVVTASAGSFNVSISAGANGSATVNGKASVVAEGGSVVDVVITPDSGYQVASIKVNGADYPASKSFQLTVSGNTEIAVQFVTKAEYAGISINTNDIVTDKTYVFSGKEYPSIVAYYKLLIPDDWSVRECGMKFGPNGELKLKAVNFEDDVFGIRVFGSAVTKGVPYKLQGYASYAESNEEYTTEEISCEIK